MAQITFKGKPVRTLGELPPEGVPAPSLNALVGADLKEVGLDAFGGKKKLLNIFPSIDTGICAMSVKKFHEKVSGRDDLVVLNISADLPFAAKRFCAAEGVENALTLSTFRSTFGTDYGVEMADGPMKGLLGRAVVIVDENDKVIYRELVPEIVQEPNYDAALGAV